MTIDDGKLDVCGCCEGVEPRKARYNRPGLPAIDYRLDTHSGFFRRALSKLHLQKVPDKSQPLRDLTTRSRDDPAIAFLDAWALVADVLTFYQERAANEGFLRTLQERRSALELARAIGYELKPGVAASVHLAFSMEDSPGSPKTTLVPEGLGVKSIPPPGKLPQTFETFEEIEARVEWNALAPQLTEEQRVGDGSTEMLLEGLDTFLQPGDAVLFVGSEDGSGFEGESWQKCVVKEVNYAPNREIVSVKWDEPLKERTKSLLFEGHHENLKEGDPIFFESECGENRPLAAVRDLCGDTLAVWNMPLTGGQNQLLIKSLGVGIKAGDDILFGPVPGQDVRIIQSATLLKRVVGDVESDVTLLVLEKPFPSENGSKKLLIDDDYSSKLGQGDAVVFVGEYRQARAIESVEEIDGKTLVAWDVPLFDGSMDLLLNSQASSVGFEVGEILIFMDAEKEVRLRKSVEFFLGRSLVTWADPLVDGSKGLLLQGDYSSVTSLLFEDDPWQVRTVVEANESATETLVTLDGPIEDGTMQLLARVASDELSPAVVVGFGIYAWQVREIKNVEFGSDSKGYFTVASWETPLFGEHKGMRLKGTGETIEVNDCIWFECQRWQMRILTTVKLDPVGGRTIAAWEVPLEGLGDPEDESFVNPQVFAMRERPDLYRSSLAEGKIDLEGTYPRILPGSWVAMTPDEGLYRVKAVSLMSQERTVEVPRPGDGPPLEFSSKVKITRIEPEAAEGLAGFSELENAVFAQSEPLSLAVKIREGLIEGETIELDRAVYGLVPEKTLIVSGKPMRARIDVDGLSLTSSKGVEKTLYRDDSLQVLKPPETVELLWTLLTEDCFEGTVVADVGDIVFKPPSDLDDEKLLAQVKVGGLKLVSEGGVDRDLVEGEALKVSDSPEDAKLIWTLRDGDGFEGSVTALAGEISFQPAQEKDSIASEVVTLDGTRRSGGRTVLSLKEPMESCYDPATFAVRANVARATHGETLNEVLGSGDGSKPNQRFELGKPYMTYVSAPTSTGTKSTLKVRVNGVLWKELASLYGTDERSQSYIVRIDDDALATVIFGDGKSGARLPTGDENVTATYRNGIGPDGEVAAESLTILQSRPLGISEVTNPLPASGSAPPEKLSDARYNAPLTVLTLDRIVSLLDFEHFVRSFAGIGKAQAVSIPRGQSKVVHITIASSSGKEVNEGSELYKNLVKAIDAMRDPVARVRERVFVESFQLQTFSLKAGVLIDPRLVAEEVLDRVKTELRRTFSFENRDFGQFVTAAEVLAVIQAVEGVIAVDLDRLERNDAPQAGTSLTSVLVAEKARIDEESGAILPAELLLLNPADEGALLEELRS
ncbi:MAG TPA: putative baseplate assembly protein [Methanothrix sp.]|nr:putative baseplate assembly protein [Methanothrix sp.]